MSDISQVRMPNGDVYDLKDQYSVHQKPDHVIEGADGWYKFMDISVANNTTINFILLVQETYAVTSGATAGRAFGIWKIILTTTSTGSQGCNITQLASNIYTNEDIGRFIDTENNKFQFFFKKIGSSNYDRSLQHISSQPQNRHFRWPRRHHSRCRRTSRVSR